MIRLIRFMITGDWHLHEWEPHGGIARTFDEFGDIIENRQPCRCKHCGKIKSFKL